MKLLTLILAILALCWCLRLNYQIACIPDPVVSEKIIYHVKPKAEKPWFGMSEEFNNKEQ